MKVIKNFLGLILLFTFSFHLTQVTACTNFIVGKKASVDGSVMVTYNADSYGMYGNMYRHVGGTHQKGEMRKVIEWDTNKYLGEIPQAEVTYNVVGQMNENQVSVTETTFGGREELMDSTGIVDYGSLIYISLERSKTAREALKVITTLAEKYGFCSAGETYSICDKNEVWLLEMMGKGPGGKGAVWAAVRVPDDCITGHANQSRITKFLKLYPKQDVLYSKDCIKFAREKGYFKGKDENFSFRDAYAPCDFGANRVCEARVWSFFRRHTDGMDQYLPYVSGKDQAHMNDEMPLYIRPNHKLTLQDMMAGMRDHYEDTPFDIRNDVGAGAYQMPYRPTPLYPKVKDAEGKEIEVFHERPVSTQQSGFGYVGQMRGWLPDEIGGVVWWTNDDPNMAPYVPVFCGVNEIPKCFVRVEGQQDEVTFSWESAFWLQNMVANMVYPYYNKMFPDLKQFRDKLENSYFELVQNVTPEQLQGTNVRNELTTLSLYCANTMMQGWTMLHKYLVVRHNDMIIKGVNEKGEFLRNKQGLAGKAKKPGYSQEFWEKILKETGDRYKK